MFSGVDPAYPPVKGWHGFSLPGRLAADLGPYWQEHRAQWADDAVAVLFDWLGAHVVDCVRRAGADDDLLASDLRPHVQYAVRALLGVDPRRVPAAA